MISGGDRFLVALARPPWRGILGLLIAGLLALVLVEIFSGLKHFLALFYLGFVELALFGLTKASRRRYAALLARYDEAYAARDVAQVVVLRPLLAGKRGFLTKNHWCLFDADAAAIDGRSDAAIALFDASTDPSFKDLARVRARRIQLLVIGNPARAVEEAKEAVRRAEESPAFGRAAKRGRAEDRRAARMLLGVAQSANGEHEAAVKTLCAVLAKDKSKARQRYARHSLASALLALRRTDEAVALLEQNALHGGPWAVRAADLLAKAAGSPHRGLPPTATAVAGTGSRTAPTSRSS